MPTTREGGEHERGTLVRGVRGFPRENFEFLALLCANFHYWSLLFGETDSNKSVTYFCIPFQCMFEMFV